MKLICHHIIRMINFCYFLLLQSKARFFYMKFNHRFFFTLCSACSTLIIRRRVQSKPFWQHWPTQHFLDMNPSISAAANGFICITFCIKLTYLHWLDWSLFYSSDIKQTYFVTYIELTIFGNLNLALVRLSVTGWHVAMKQAIKPDVFLTGASRSWYVSKVLNCQHSSIINYWIL